MEGNAPEAEPELSEAELAQREPSKKMIRELGYIAKAPAENRVSRAERGGGLDYYRERKDQFDSSNQRKKHGHLQNLISGAGQDGYKSKLKNKAKEFVETQLKKKLMSSTAKNLLKQNLDSLNLPSQLENMFPEKVGVYD